MNGWLRERFARLAAFFRKDRLDRELEQELATHLDLATEDNIRRGLSPEEARREARVKLGGVESAKELHREARGLPRLDTLLQDLRYAGRSLRRDPGFHIAGVLILGLGIGANTAIFSVVDGVLLRPAPVADLDRLTMVWETDRHTGTTREPASVPDFLDFRTRSRSFERLAALMGAEVNLTPAAGEPVRLAALSVTHDLLPMLGMAPVVGRTFTTAEDAAGGPRVVLISEPLWERSFGRDPAVVGETLRLDEEAHTIVGVVPEQADFGILQILSSAAYSRSWADRGGGRARVDVWAPLQPDPERLPRETHPIFVLGQLAPGSTPGSAQKEMAAIAADLERAYPANDARGVFVEPLAEVVFGPVRPALYVLLGAVGLVLLVACVNVANLLLARGTTRFREVAVRAALGGSRARLARQFLVENLVLTLVSGLAGVALAYAGLRALLALAPADIPRLSQVTIDLRVLAVTLLVSVAAGLAFGMVPILQAQRIDLQTALRGEGASTLGGPGRSGLRRALVVAELALAVVLVVGAALLIKSFWHLSRVDSGFRTAGVLKAEYQLPPARYPANFARWPNFQEMHAFSDALASRAAALPGVDAVALAGNHPLDPGFTNSFRVVGREAESRTWPEISIRRVTPGYCRTVGLTRLSGRLLQDSDGTFANPVLLINEAAARLFFAGRDPLGAKINFWGADRTIVGVVANERFRGPAEAPPIAVYVPLAQAPSANGAGVLLVRTLGDPLALTSALRQAIREVDPALAVFGLESLDEALSRSVAERRFTMLLLGLFAAVALALAAVGVHGVLSFGVARRTREIGLRMALGAQPRGVLGLIVEEGLALAAVGLAAGLLGALALTRLLSSQLFGVTPTDPATFVGVALFLAAVTLMASYLPARRATKVDPAVALRTE